MARYELDRKAAERKGYHWEVWEAPHVDFPARVVYFPTLSEAMAEISWYVWHKRATDNQAAYCELYRTELTSSICWTRNVSCVSDPELDSLYLHVFVGARL